MIYPRVALIGLGLIASSMAHAMRAGGLAGEIVGYARSAETRAVAKDLFCDRVTDSAAEAVKGADLVVLAVPVGVMGEIAAEIAPHLKPGATVTDVGSVKRAVVDAVAPHVPAGVHFIPGHPLAGTEYSGPRSGFATLFQNRWWLLTPASDVDSEALTTLRSLLLAMGANVDEMDVDHHDLVLGVVSHVPDAIAYTLVGVASMVAAYFQSLGNAREALMLTLGGMLLVKIPVLLLASRLFGLHGIWAAEAISELILCAVSLLMLRSYHAGRTVKWAVEQV